MASRRASTVTSGGRNTSAEAKCSKTGANPGKSGSSGPAKKQVKPGGTVVKSRYLQSAERSSLSKSNSLNNESVATAAKPSSPKPTMVKPKLGISPRRSMAPPSRPPSMSASVLEPFMQSTFSDAPCFRPDFDISVIRDKTVMENVVETERCPELDKTMVDTQTFLLAYMTAKMESNTAKLRAEAETRILQEMDVEEALQYEVQQKKRQYLLSEKDRLIDELLDLQISALTPVVEGAKQFTQEYKTFATAVDITRHELPVKNVYMEGSREEFMGKAEACLKESEKVLAGCTRSDHQENVVSLECLKNMKSASKDIRQQLFGLFSGLQELSSLVCRHTILDQQTAEEEQMGTARCQQLYNPKH